MTSQQFTRQKWRVWIETAGAYSAKARRSEIHPPEISECLLTAQPRLRTTDTTSVMTVSGTTNHSITLLKVPRASCACAARIR